jgi:hypothetical protein
MATEVNRGSRWLHLFTSTIREQYIADALDVIAAPVGAIHRFRYQEKYLETETRKAWAAGQLAGKSVAVHFSIQHPAMFHAAMFIPLRRGEVVETHREGSAYIVNFRLGAFLPLRDDPNWEDQKERRVPVEEFTEALKVKLDSSQPDGKVSATLGAAPTGLLPESSGNDGADFETLVRYLTPSLFFSPRTYFRCVDVVNAKGISQSLSRSGVLNLTAGMDYMLHLSHYQFAQLNESVIVRVTSPKGLNLIGDSDIHLRSRYDVIPLSLFALPRDDLIAGELKIEVLEPGRGSTVRIPLTIAPPTRQMLSGPALGVGGAMAVAMPAILVSNQNLHARVLWGLAGPALVGLGVWLRRTKGLPT